MKRLISLFLAMLLAFGLFSCASPAPQAAPPVPTAVEVPAQPPAQLTTAPTEAIAPEQDPNTVITFDDDVLESMIRTAMNKPDGDITVADALSVTQLDFTMDGSNWSNPRIHSLDALKNFTNLTNLSMSWALQNEGKGVDLSPLSGLTKLEVLLLGCVEIYDISPLKPLVNLKSLWIWGCRYLSDIGALSGMTSMQDLWIKGNSIQDLSPIANMKNLDRLYMEENLVQDLSPLAGLTKLTSLLVSDNPVKDYSVLSGIYPNLVEKDFEPVAAPQPIQFNDTVLEQRVREALNIPSGDITMAQTESVTTLSLANEWQESVPDEIKVKDIQALKYFPNLEKLEMQNNAIQEIDELRIMKNLNTLDLANNPVRDIHALSSFTNLSQLNLSGTRCTAEGLASIGELTKLTWLDLSYCSDLKDVSALAGLVNLQSLYLNNMPLDFTPLAGLTNLTTLYLAQPFGDYKPDYSVLKDIYPNLIDKNFEPPQS
ncbi:MAG: leucine-rich repeat domain-containing protein [Clostridiaceae bacterium]